MNSIPVIDISILREGAPAKTLKPLAEQMHRALKEIGFAYISQHGVAQKLQDDLHNLAQKFFAEPLAEKNRIAMAHAGRAWRGYFPVGGELTANEPDQKEGLYFGSQHLPAHPGVVGKWPMHGANLWPEGKAYESFAGTVLAYMKELEQLGHRLMELVALGLGLEQHYFRKRFSSDPTTLFRIFNYPGKLQNKGGWGVGQHTDMGFLTVLLQDDSGGLEVQSPSGEWLEAPPVAGTFVINIGDMLQYWTHGIYRATLHRVKNVTDYDRLSFPFFFDPNWQCTLQPIPKSLLRPKDVAVAKKRLAKERWDGLDLHGLTPGTTYGGFVWNKISKVFPDLAQSSG